jgi:hypothetical protein
MAMRRPYAISSPGTAETLAVSQPATASDAASPMVPAIPGDCLTTWPSAKTALTAASTINTCSQPLVPIQGMSTRLKASAPRMAPPVLAA